ncbi:hypothetical protein TRFO_02595 [Tritrichomonas foetus]|uniref:Ras-GEF domain-containing protein n=1 Tax=Tritrichomonas foetus TaxID=1144522 RepID=A0A1J4L265_9EUKA|nr:hypothetical protein TRFO_02595 [Tritrichomonas foetus]|eukprot:OHT17539.1 hypothetical protein TRFO_02595 [Tritrichomonas foetus]
MSQQSSNQRTTPTSQGSNHKLAATMIPKISYKPSKSRNRNSENSHSGNHSISRVDHRQIGADIDSSSDSESPRKKIKSRVLNQNLAATTIEITKTSSSRRQHSVSSHKNSRRVEDSNHQNSNSNANSNSVTIERRRVKRRVPIQEGNSTSSASHKIRGESVSRSSKSRSIVHEEKLLVVKRSPKSKNNCPLKFSTTLTVDHYYIQRNPQPLDGKLVSELNGSINKSSIKLDEELQYVVPYNFIPGPTAPKQPGHDHRRTKSASSVSKTSNLLADLFLDDDCSLQFFSLDFGTSYVTSLEDDDPLSDNTLVSYSPNFFTFEAVPAPLVEKLRQQEIVNQVLRIVYDNRAPLQDYNGFNLTNVMIPDENEVKYLTMNKIVYIDCISPSSFFDFRFGPKVTENLPDKFHLFVWHNLGIPPLPIAKNVEKALKNLDPQYMSHIAQYIFLWLYYYPEDFYDSPNCADIILKMTKKMVTKNTNLVLCQAAIIRALVLALKNKTNAIEEFSPKLPSPNMRGVLQITDLMELNVDPSVLANHFMYIDLEMMHKLQRREFVHDNWKTRPELSTNINSMIERFNEVSAFIATTILVDSERQRVKFITFWINVMDTARKNKNYHLLAEIDAALNCLPIRRLKSSWKQVNQHILEKYNQLKNFFNNKDFKNEMIESPEITMPFLGLFLSELSQTFDDEPLKRPLPSGSDGYNMGLHRKYYSIVENIFADWGTDLRFELDIKLLEECRVLSGRARRPEDLILPSINFESVRPNEKRFLDEYLKKC